MLLSKPLPGDTMPQTGLWCYSKRGVIVEVKRTAHDELGKIVEKKGISVRWKDACQLPRSRCSSGSEGEGRGNLITSVRADRALINAVPWSLTSERLLRQRLHKAPNLGTNVHSGARPWASVTSNINLGCSSPNPTRSFISVSIQSAPVQCPNQVSRRGNDCWKCLPPSAVGAEWYRHFLSRIVLVRSDAIVLETIARKWFIFWKTEKGRLYMGLGCLS